jgi:hypothetical protein
MQRIYVRWELVELAKSYPRVEVAHALAASAEWSKATEMADEELAAQKAAEAEDAENSGGEVFEDWNDAISGSALEMAKAGVVNNDRGFLEQARQEVKKVREEKYPSAMQQIAVETARAGIANNDPKLIEQAEQEVDKSPSAIAEIALTIARPGDTTKASNLLKKALKQAWQDAQEKEKNQDLLKNKNNGDSREVQDVVLKMAKTGIANKDAKLVEDAEQEARKLPEKLVRETLEQIAVEMAIVAIRNGDQKLSGQSLQRAKTLDWENKALWERSSLSLWTIFVAAGDEEKAKEVLQSAEAELDDRQGPSGDGFPLSVIPVEIAKVALAKNNAKLLDEAESYSNYPTYARPRVLRNIAVEIVKHGYASKATALLEQAWQAAGELGAERSDEYSALRNLIAGDMATLGHLRRAREIAETASGKLRAEAIAAVVLADSEVTYSRRWPARD